MSDSLRDQLLGLGFKTPEPVARAKPESEASRTARARPDARGGDERRPSGGERRDRPPTERDRPRGNRPASPSNPARAVDSPRLHRGKGTSGRGDMDLGKAYALRAQHEKDERLAAERERQIAAQRKREARARVQEIVSGQARNDSAAEIARHFEYNGRIRRVHVTLEQLRAVNAGELGVVQIDGRYLLFEAAVVEQVREQLPSLVALKVVPGSEVDDPYADPRYQVPDDLVW